MYLDFSLRSAYPIRPGVWHSVRVSRTGRWAWLYVDDQPVVSGLTPGGFTMLSLSHPLYLGGIPPTSVSQPILPASQAFVGCIQKVKISCCCVHVCFCYCLVWVDGFTLFSLINKKGKNIFFFRLSYVGTAVLWRVLCIVLKIIAQVYKYIY